MEKQKIHSFVPVLNNFFFFYDPIITESTSTLVGRNATIKNVPAARSARFTVRASPVRRGAARRCSPFDVILRSGADSGGCCWRGVANPIPPFRRRRAAAFLTTHKDSGVFVNGVGDGGGFGR